MTPKEKAKELVEFFKPLVYSHVGSQFLTGTHDERLILKNSKKCANRCVDENISQFEIKMLITSNENTHNFCYQALKYWQEVKQRIKKL